MNTRKNIFSQFASARKMIAYHAEWRKFTGSVSATILLQQINFLWDGNGQKAFYKFRVPCNHSLYKSGDSWTEELGFSVKEFDAAIKRIGQKISKRKRAKNPEIDHHTKPVEYWVDQQRITWYRIHEKNFMALLATLYDVPEPPKKQTETPDTPDCSSLPKGERGNRPKENFVIAETANTKLPKGELDVIAKTAITKSPKGEIDQLQRDQSEKREKTERESRTLSIFKTYFPNHILKKWQEKEMEEKIRNMAAWEYTCQLWQLKKYQLQYGLSNLFDRYNHETVNFTETRTEQSKQTTERSTQATEQSKQATEHTKSGSEWDRIVANLQQRINTPSFNTWIRPCVAEPIGKNERPVKVFVPDEVFVFWLGEHYYRVMQDAYETVCGRRPDIEFVIHNRNVEDC